MRQIVFITLILGTLVSSVMAEDVIQRMRNDRILTLLSPIDDKEADSLVAGLNDLASISSDPVQIYINSPGGLVDKSLMIIQAMNDSKLVINTVCIGKAGGTAALILAMGDNAFAIESAEITIDPILGENQPSLVKFKSLMAEYLSENTDLNLTESNLAFEEGMNGSLEDWVAIGLIDRILTKP